MLAFSRICVISRAPFPAGSRIMRHGRSQERSVGSPRGRAQDRRKVAYEPANNAFVNKIASKHSKFGEAEFGAIFGNAGNYNGSIWGE